MIVFFDPDKPGTTGETLQVFKEALSGIDHKLLIVMNKMDQFQNMHDFARAYGALCWNLGKITLRKDLPLIYNTFVPIPGKPASKLPVDDFNEARNGLVEELRSAPARRLDNLITQVQTFAERLRLHALVIDEAARRFRAVRMKWRGALVGLFAATSAAAVVTGMLIALPGVLAVFAILALVVESIILPREKKRLVARFDDIFERIHEQELLMRDRDMDLRALWAEVHPHARDVAQKCGLQSFAKLTRSERTKLAALIQEDIPQLRSALYGCFGDTGVAVAPSARELLAQPHLSEVVSSRDIDATVPAQRRKAVV